MVASEGREPVVDSIGKLIDELNTLRQSNSVILENVTFALFRQCQLSKVPNCSMSRDFLAEMSYRGKMRMRNGGRISDYDVFHLYAADNSFRTTFYTKGPWIPVTIDEEDGFRRPFLKSSVPLISPEAEARFYFDLKSKSD